MKLCLRKRFVVTGFIVVTVITVFKSGMLIGTKDDKVLPTVDLMIKSIMPVTRTSASWTSLYDDLDLYVRMTTKGKQIPYFYEKILVQSMKYFWPANVSLVVVLDGEHKPDHGFGNNTKHKFPFPRICYMEEVKGLGYSGKDRMQRDMFYPEKCTSKKYVGFVDTDTMFVTRVIPEILFDGDKPIVLGIYGSPVTSWFSIWANATRHIFNMREVMRCMSYFPVIFKVEHVVQLRGYLEKLHNLTFDKILPIHGRIQNMYSQFHLMCQYIWLFHRDEYTFHLQFVPKIPPNLPPGVQSLDYYNRMLTPSQKIPFPRSSIHYNHYHNWTQEVTYKRILKTGLCFSGGFSSCPDKCKGLKNYSLQTELFKFEFHTDWSWEPRCFQTQVNHYKLVHNRADEQYSKVIQDACAEVDTLSWKP